MAYWNAPQDCKNHADLAVSSALNQLYRLEELNHTIKENYDLELCIGKLCPGGQGINLWKAVLGIVLP